MHKALEVAVETPKKTSRRNNNSNRTRPQVRPIRILLRPGMHYLYETIHIDARLPVSIETLDLPKNLFQPTQHLLRRERQDVPEGPISLSSSSTSSSKTSRSALRNLMRCHRPDSVVQGEEPTEFAEHDEDDDEWWIHSNTTPIPRRATLVFKSRRDNEPAVRICRGRLDVHNVAISHHSEGLDIWNGNAAVQVQPSEDALPSNNINPPQAILRGVHVSSRTGRGVVNIDGGHLQMSGCAVTDCAATGIYIGGPGSRVVLEQTDVVRNGLGYCNSNRRMGIARGHSGVYLEQGVAQIVDCNISQNTLTGISAVSPDNAILTLEMCDLMSNGTNQLEMPQPGTVGRHQSLLRHNHMSVMGWGRSRSGLVAEQPRSSLLRNSP